MIDFFNLFAIRKYRLPENWRWFRLERMEGGTVVTGAVCTETYKRGPNKDTPKWSKRDPSTERKVIVQDEEFATFQLEWERTEGKCHKCQGSGQELAGWSAAAGTQWRQCSRCKGTGKPNP